MTSQSPLSETATLNYSDSWAAVNRLIREGESWSGRELNCALVNTGAGTFMDVSNTMGLAFADDGRNFVACDWDGDGDLDLWVKNRTAPQLRFLRNDGARGSWLRLRLENSAPNWDAIGARVEVRAGGQLVVRERRAGSEFLVQGSEWLHFGLGQATSIESLTVRWPGGVLESFSGAAISGRYVLQRGTGVAEARNASPRTLALQAGKVTPPRPEDVTRVVLTEHLAVPDLQVTTLTGQSRPLRGPGTEDAPLLINFWSSTCHSCLGELRDWSKSADKLGAAGLRVLALAVDTDSAAAQDLWKRMDLPFAVGLAPARVIALFDLLQRLAVDHQRDMAVPTSFLLDKQGRIAVIYRGPVEVPTLLGDIADLDNEAPPFAGAPFPGRAFRSARGLRLFDVARRLLDRGAAQDALFYLDAGEAKLKDPRGRSRPGDQASLADALMRAAVAFMDNGELDRALSTILRATALAGPDDAIIWFAKAKLESVRGNHTQAVIDVKKSIELDGQFATAWGMLGSLKLILGDTPGSIEAQHRAVQIDPGMASAWSGLAVGYLTTGQLEKAEHAFQQVVRLDPGSADGWTGLGMCLVGRGQRESGAAALRKALAIDPDNARALEMLKTLGLR